MSEMTIIAGVLDEVFKERIRQDNKWGQQDPSDFDPRYQSTMDKSSFYRMPHPDVAKSHCDTAAKEKRLTFMHILVEEVAETMEAKTDDELRTELIQVSAVAASWVEAIDRRMAKHINETYGK